MEWDARFAERSPWFWPIARAASALGSFEAWPEADDLACVFDGDAPVRFERAAPKPRRGRIETARYDARITVDRVVPTRARSWHDLLNALVWATFPRAKLALHARQHRMIAARAHDDGSLPGARTAEQDAVAMLDEGGVAWLRAGRAECAVVFGHAIYEGLVAEPWAKVRAAAYAIDLDAIPESPAARVAIADGALASLLARDAPIGKGDFGSLVVDGTAA